MIKKSIPNAITFANLALGILSILEINKRHFYIAALLIILAAFIDRYDGRVARYLNVSSELGKSLDSLSDLISFGVAPGILIYTKFNFMDINYLKVYSLFFLIIYVVCGAYRLAKYNVSEFNGTFVGIPITISGFVLALYSLAMPYNAISKPLSAILLMLCAYLMVSKYEFKKV